MYKTPLETLIFPGTMSHKTGVEKKTVTDSVGMNVIAGHSYRKLECPDLNFKQCEEDGLVWGSLHLLLLFRIYFMSIYVSTMDLLQLIQ